MISNLIKIILFFIILYVVATAVKKFIQLKKAQYQKNLNEKNNKKSRGSHNEIIELDKNDYKIE